MISLIQILFNTGVHIIKISYIFKSDEELLEFIQKEVCKYVGNYNRDQVLYSYNRMTVEELSQEVFMKLLRSVQEEGKMNKSYVRRAVVFVCIDEYRKISDMDLRLDSAWVETHSQDDSEIEYTNPDSKLVLEHEEAYRDVERFMSLDIFEPKELKVMLKLMEGLRNPEVREELGIPKMTYYTLLKKLRIKYIDNYGTVEI